MFPKGSKCLFQPSPAFGPSPPSNKKPNSNNKPTKPPFVEFPTLCNCRHRHHAQEEDTNHLRRFEHRRRAQAQPHGAAHVPYESDWEGTNRDGSSRADEIVDCGIAKKSMEGNGFERWVFWYVLSEDEDLVAAVVLLLTGIRYANAGDRIERGSRMRLADSRPQCLLECNRDSVRLFINLPSD
ncbi:hypothetical protein DVH24_027366 [Malus domestica]|uniref:Uncharacterized protein n=1 Tax=Malus domestica TaxID=3750 RepID=A0A498KQR1_MALDO|nr:hypothetical protein DVH24_027700 [Malus domestica]RXI09896.1 hypothetical protein DVH24_027366 [Malus domestica]